MFKDTSGSNKLSKPVLIFCCNLLLAFMLNGVPLKVFEKDTLELKSWFSVFVRSRVGLF
jgi:hypothetical protein